ncbi:toll/interleukin-1 receptor domain-containing protein [Pedobacter agri]|uniref:toll/interleukin-1 receptor domain-containing protein n=1 Tax=Pedobacter agri TaxID=454586 RepID=UPI0029300E9A|nr:toll/interleukin-1 receptor domain-containing protein [Pedobacter agri]
MGANIEADFAYDISIADFPWSTEIKKNPLILNELREEFSHLKPRPKLHWYFREFISDEVWASECTSNRGSTVRSGQAVAASFSFPSETEQLASKIIKEFNELTLADKVDQKFYGRFIDDTLTVKTLREIDKQFETFRHFIGHEEKVENYGDFANASAKGILRLVKELPQELKKFLLNEFSKISVETDFRFMIRLSNKSEVDRRIAVERFNILKTYFTQVIIEEGADLKNSIPTPISDETNTIPSFATYLMGEPDWSEIQFLYNTGKQYQQKQDLTAVFWNSFIYIEQKFKPYFEKYRSIDYVTLEELIYKFRQKFGLKNRVKEVNYYDDLIEQMIGKYEKLNAMDFKNMTRDEKLNVILEFAVQNKSRHNIALATVHIDVFKTELPGQETRQLFQRVIDSGKVKVMGGRYIGCSIDTEEFLREGGFGGIYHGQNKDANLELAKPQVFFSYCWANKQLAEKIYSDIKDAGIDCKKDTVDMQYRDNIIDFMESIREADYAILLISDNYLKSANCMVEFSHLMKERGVEKKVLPIIVAGTEIYTTTDRLKYLSYWKDQHAEMKTALELVDVEDALEENKKLREIRNISQDINANLNFVSTLLNVPIEELEISKYEPLLNIIGQYRSAK